MCVRMHVRACVRTRVRACEGAHVRVCVPRPPSEANVFEFGPLGIAWLQHTEFTINYDMIIIIIIIVLAEIAVV